MFVFDINSNLVMNEELIFLVMNEELIFRIHASSLLEETVRRAEVIAAIPGLEPATPYFRGKRSTAVLDYPRFLSCCKYTFSGFYILENVIQPNLLIPNYRCVPLAVARMSTIAL